MTESFRGYVSRQLIKALDLVRWGVGGVTDDAMNCHFVVRPHIQDSFRHGEHASHLTAWTETGSEQKACLSYGFASVPCVDHSDPIRHRIAGFPLYD